MSYALLTQAEEVGVLGLVDDAYCQPSLEDHPLQRQSRMQTNPRSLRLDYQRIVYNPFEDITIRESKCNVKPEVNVPSVAISEVGDSRDIPDAQLHSSNSGTFLSGATTTPAQPTAEMGSSQVPGRREGAGPIGPHPSTIKVSAQYMSQAAISQALQNKLPTGAEHQERSIAEAREDNIRLQGVTWIDNVRRALQLPIKTYTTACVLFHKFRLAHTGQLNGMDYNNAWADACAASLLAAGKIEDTHKKSRDILAAAYNLKASVHDQLSSDDPYFEAHSSRVIGLERLVLEAICFDFRIRQPHKLLVKLVKSMPEGDDGEQIKVRDKSWTVMTDLYRTFAPLKQSSSTMALACLELAVQLVASSTPNNTSPIRDALQAIDTNKWSTTREEVMETLLDLLDLYTQHTAQSVLGTQHSLDDFLRIRLAYNKECNEKNLPRYVSARAAAGPPANGGLRLSNGHPTPVSPMEPGSAVANATQTPDYPAIPEGGGTLRFMLDPQRAAEERAEVARYFAEEWEEYEEEVEVEEELTTREERPPPASSNSGSSGNYWARRREAQSRISPAEREREFDREWERDRVWGDEQRRRYNGRGGRGGPPPPRRYDDRFSARRMYEDPESRHRRDDRR